MTACESSKSPRSARLGEANELSVTALKDGIQPLWFHDAASRAVGVWVGEVPCIASLVFIHLTPILTRTETRFQRQLQLTLRLPYLVSGNIFPGLE